MKRYSNSIRTAPERISSSAENPALTRNHPPEQQAKGNVPLRVTVYLLKICFLQFVLFCFALGITLSNVQGLLLAVIGKLYVMWETEPGSCKPYPLYYLSGPSSLNNMLERPGLVKRDSRGQAVAL